MKLAALLFFLFLSFSTSAGEIRYNSKGVLQFEGKIVDGDAERLVQMVLANRLVAMVELNSPGGSIKEALRIANLIKYLRRSVQVSRGGICASSCFLIFIASHDRSASGADFKMPQGVAPFGLVGLHRPYFSAEVNRNIPVDTLIEHQVTAIKQMKAYLKDELVPERLIDKMMSKPSNDIYLLTENDLFEIGQYAPGFEEVLISKCNYTKDMIARLSKLLIDGSHERYSKELDAFIACEADASDRLITVYLDNFERIDVPPELSST